MDDDFVFYHKNFVNGEKQRYWVLNELHPTFENNIVKRDMWYIAFTDKLYTKFVYKFWGYFI